MSDMRRPPASLRHITAHSLAFTAVALTVLFTTTAAAAAAAFASTITGIAARQSLRSAAGNTILVSTQASATAAAPNGALVTAALRRASAGLPLAVTGSVQSPYLNLPSAGPGGPQRLAQIISLPGLAHHASLLSGSWPAGRGRGPVPVCVPAQPASQLRLAVGQTLALLDAPDRTTVTVRVSCIFRGRQLAAPYWSLSPVGPAGVQHSGGSVIYGPLVTSAAVMAGGQVPVGSAAWLAQPDFSRLHVPGLAALGSRIGAAAAQLTNSAALNGANVTTQLPALLGNLATALVVARSQLLIGVLILLVIAGATVTVTVRLLAMQREPEAALLAARGASRRQMAARGVSDALLLAIPAALAGPFIAAWLVPLTTRFGALARAGLRLHPGEPASAWLASAAVAAGCAVIISLPWLRQPPSPVRQRVQRGRQRVVSALAAAGADGALVVLAIAAGWQLAHYSAPVTTGIEGQVGVDPILASAPVLALSAGTLVTLRLLPLAARLADKAAARGRGLTAAVAAWQISRRPLRQTGPALLAVLAVATAVVALTENASWRHSVQSQAQFAAGADTRITLPDAGPLAVGQVAGITRAPGVQASTPAVRLPFSLQGAASATLLALDPRPAASVVALQTEVGTRALAGLLAELAPRGPAPGVPVPGRPARLAVTARLDGTGMSQPGLLAQLTDAAGVSYEIPAGTLPADGRSHQLTVVVSPGRQADYPLRLVGFSLQYLQVGQRSAAASLTIESVRTAASMQGPFGSPLPAAAAPGLLALTDQSAGAPSPSGAQPAGSGIVANFRTSSSAGYYGSGPVPAALTLTAGPATGPVPALATSSFLAASGARVGRSVQVSVQGVAIPVVVVRQISRFATVTGPSGGLIVSQEALQDALRTLGQPPVPATEWWLRTSRSPVLTGLPPGSSVTSMAVLARSLSAQPLSAAPLQALLAIAAAAVALACGGFVISVMTGRDRQRDVAMLDALGARPGQVLRLLCLEQAMVAVPAAAAGLLLGVLLSLLIVPAVSLTAQAAHPDPPILVQLPWAAAIGVAVVIAAVPTLAAGLLATRRIAAAAVLRVEEEQ